MPTSIYLCTIAIEPNRHAAGKHPSIDVTEWTDRISERGFDGIELWENHVLRVPETELVDYASTKLRVNVFNSYVGFGHEQEAMRARVAETVHLLHAPQVKFNFGSNPLKRSEEIENVRRFSEQLPSKTQLLCECHAGTIAETPELAASLLEELGDETRFGAIVHLQSRPEILREWLRRLGKRICHCHVFLPVESERNSGVGGEMAIRALMECGYNRSFSVEFVWPLNAAGETPELLFEKAVADMIWLRSSFSRNA